MKKEWKVALVGAHGLVGKSMIEDLFRLDFPMDCLTLYGSKEHANVPIKINGTLYPVFVLNEENIQPFDLVFFSGNEEIAEKYAPLFIKKGAVVIDNSSFFRMHKDVPLVIPEINKEDILEHHGLIANPNCTTIILLVALSALHEKYHLEKIYVSTYQSSSGAGKEALEELKKESKDQDYIPQILPSHNAKKKTLYDNVLPVVDDFLDNGFTKEEMKVRFESKKILHLPELEVNVTCARVATTIGHAMSVMTVFKEKVDVDEAIHLLKQNNSIKVFIAPDYPTLEEIRNEPYIAVGRLKKDLDCDYTLDLFITGDNLVRGASYNAIQIGWALWKLEK